MNWYGILVLSWLAATAFCAGARADALGDLATRTDLTPERLIHAFAGFSFELNAEPQDEATFMRRRRGDCDDFACLASRLLTERGYKTKLVVVMMEQQTHVVCYVKEARGFLDFNHRADAHPIVESDEALETIAQKVAGDFHQLWRMASEFKYEDKQPKYLQVVFRPAVATSDKETSRETPTACSGTPSASRTTLAQVADRSRP